MAKNKERKRPNDKQLCTSLRGQKPYQNFDNLYDMYRYFPSFPELQRNLKIAP